MKTILAAVALAVVAAPVIARPPARPLTPKQAHNRELIRRAQAAARYSAKDPSSAQFRAVAVITDHGPWQKVCGQMNAKNSYGGYTGFERFVWIESHDEVHFLSEQSPEWVEDYRGCYDMPG